MKALSFCREWVPWCGWDLSEVLILRTHNLAELFYTFPLLVRTGALSDDDYSYMINGHPHATF